MNLENLYQALIFKKNSFGIFGSQKTHWYKYNAIFYTIFEDPLVSFLQNTPKLEIWKLSWTNLVFMLIFTESAPRQIQSSSCDFCVFVCMCVCLSQSISCDYAQAVGVLVFHYTMNIVRDIIKFLNLKGHQHSHLFQPTATVIGGSVINGAYPV